MKPSARHGRRRKKLVGRSRKRSWRLLCAGRETGARSKCCAGADPAFSPRARALPVALVLLLDLGNSDRSATYHDVRVGRCSHRGLGAGRADRRRRPPSKGCAIHAIDYRTSGFLQMRQRRSTSVEYTVGVRAPGASKSGLELGHLNCTDSVGVGVRSRGWWRLGLKWPAAANVESSDVRPACGGHR